MITQKNEKIAYARDCRLPYNIYDAKNFFLKSMDDFSFDIKTVLFLENSELIIGEKGTYVMDKRIFKKDNDNYREKLISMENGTQRVIVGRNARIENTAVSVILHRKVIQNTLDFVIINISICERR